MYPILSDNLFENEAAIPQNPYELLKTLLSRFPKTVVKNGEQKGETLSAAIRFYGREVLGKNGASTSAFKNGAANIPATSVNGDLPEEEAMIYPFGIVENLVSAEDFSADRLSLDGRTGLYEKDSFMLIFACLGEFTVSHFGGTFRLSAGETVFVPADFRIEINGTGKLIIAHA
ncbi:MAG TPA: hypothetical protein DEW35_04165 [Ruminococcaceae bacterium]|nr:hypothetical protein [Oscillospiraceae bacterium]